MRIDLPSRSLVLLVGPTGSGKTTFAARHFGSTEVLSSDAFRAIVADDEADLSATDDAFEVLHRVAASRLARGRLTVIDATNVQATARRPLLELAARQRVPAVAIVFDLPLEDAAARNGRRPGRVVPRRALREQYADLQRSLPTLAAEGLATVWVLRGSSEIESVEVRRVLSPG